jgi:hypothetical protein
VAFRQSIEYSVTDRAVLDVASRHRGFSSTAYRIRNAIEKAKTRTISPGVLLVVQSAFGRISN